MRSLDDPETAVCLPMTFSASAPAATEMAHSRVFAIAYMHRQQMNLVNIRPTFWNHLKTSFRMPAAVEYVRPFRRPYNIRTEHKRILRVTKYQNIHAGQFKTQYTHTHARRTLRPISLATVEPKIKRLIFICECWQICPFAESAFPWDNDRENERECSPASRGHLFTQKWPTMPDDWALSKGFFDWLVVCVAHSFAWLFVVCENIFGSVHSAVFGHHFAFTVWLSVFPTGHPLQLCP